MSMIMRGSCDNTRYLSFLKLLIDIRSHRLVVSLIFDQWYYTFIYGHTKHSREGGRKEQTNMGLGEAVRLFVHSVS